VCPSTHDFFTTVTEQQGRPTRQLQKVRDPLLGEGDLITGFADGETGGDESHAADDHPALAPREVRARNQEAMFYWRYPACLIINTMELHNRAGGGRITRWSCTTELEAGGYRHDGCVTDERGRREAVGDEGVWSSETCTDDSQGLLVVGDPGNPPPGLANSYEKKN
jgi:hypothetical protein